MSEELIKKRYNRAPSGAFLWQEYCELFPVLRFSLIWFAERHCQISAPVYIDFKEVILLLPPSILQKNTEQNS